MSLLTMECDFFAMDHRDHHYHQRHCQCPCPRLRFWRSILLLFAFSLLAIWLTSSFVSRFAWAPTSWQPLLSRAASAQPLARCWMRATFFSHPTSKLTIMCTSWRWAQCKWCWRWEYNVSIPDGFNGSLCRRCMELEEPPWWPNHRERWEFVCVLRSAPPPLCATPRRRAACHSVVRSAGVPRGRVRAVVP